MMNKGLIEKQIIYYSNNRNMENNVDNIGI